MPPVNPGHPFNRGMLPVVPIACGTCRQGKGKEYAMDENVAWNDITGTQFSLLWRALISDFTMNSLNQALVANLGRQPLANYAPPLVNYPTQAFELIQAAKAQGWVRELIDGLIDANEEGPGLRRFRETVGLTAAIGKRAPAGWKLEDILRPNPDFLKPDGWLAKLAGLRRRVCRLEHPSRPTEKPGFGTGWLVGPDLLLTNYHVIQSFRPVMPGGLDAAEIVCRFDIPEPPARDAGRICRLAADWLVDASLPGAAERGAGNTPPTEAELDYAVLRLAERAGEDEVEKSTPRGLVALGASGGPPRKGDVLLIVQHPEGMPQRFAFGNVLNSLAPTERRLQHDANTLRGSSGSPVVDIKLDILALHHAGGKANQAVPIHLVGARLAAQGVALN